MHVLQEGWQRNGFFGRRKNEKEIEKKNVDVSEEIYHDEPFFGDDTIACENKTINK